MIATDAALAEWLPRLYASPWVALDTEADSLHSYPEKLCLVQLSLPGEDRLVDPLAPLDLAPLWRALAGREIILHAADYDLRLLWRGPRFIPHAVFDTMLAARLLGLAEFGLVNLVQRFLGVALEKGPQRADWSRRPLTERMVAYARNDVRYLHLLAQELRAQLDARGRLDWHAQMCRQAIADATQPAAPRDDDAWRIKSANTLHPRALAFLRQLWHWREREAVRANRPPFFVLSHDTLFQLAITLAHGEEPERLIPRRYSPRRRAGLLAAIQSARGVPEADWPVPRKHRGQRLTQAQKTQLERLRHRRDRAAARLGIDPTLIASRAMLVVLTAGGDAVDTDLLPWQRELLA